MDTLYYLVVGLLEPFPLFFLLAGLALVLLWRRRPPARGRLPLTLAVAALLLVSLPVVSQLALGSLECQYPPLGERPADAEALVILAGSIRPPDATRPEAELDPDTYYRCVAAARLYRGGSPCPIVASGGKVDGSVPGPTCAEAMRVALGQLGVTGTDVILEDESRTTHENAVLSARLLRNRGAGRIVLVTDAAHMPRAAACFRKQGLEVTAAPCNFRAVGLPWTVGSILPSPYAAQGSQEACHEWLGALWYWLQGRT